MPIKERDKNGRFIKRKNIFEEKDNLLYVYNDKNELLFFTDLENKNKIQQFVWGKIANGYCATKKGIMIHRFLTNAPSNKLVDHINRNKLDNRLSNLRIADKSLNAFNTNIKKNNKSGVTGVYFRNDTKKWVANIIKNYKKISLGCFDNIEDAIKIRKLKEIELYGENK